MITGDLTIAGQARPVSVPLEFTVSDGVAVFMGSVDVAPADYGIEAPHRPNRGWVADTATVELQLFLTPPDRLSGLPGAKAPEQAGAAWAREARRTGG